MKCVTCSNTDSSLLKLQTYVDNNTLKEISVILPDFEIPATQGPVYVCVTCQEQVTTFYRIKRTSLENLCHLNRYENILKTTSNVKFNDFKIIVDNNKISVKREQDIDFKYNPNCKKLSDDENQLIKKDFNSTSENSPHKDQLKNHCESEKKIFKCTDCHKLFTQRSNLKAHSRVHTGEKPYKCLTCQKTFATSSHLNQHKLTHTGDKPHECDICHKSFKLKSHLITHKRIHNNERPFQCAVCNKAFIQSGDLQRHMLSHTGEKPHQCHLCEYKSAHAAALKKHIRRHTGEKPYSCKHCKKSFTTSSDLKRHDRSRHSNENSK